MQSKTRQSSMSDKKKIVLIKPIKKSANMKLILSYTLRLQLIKVAVTEE